jgi:hypothetical protein
MGKFFSQAEVSAYRKYRYTLTAIQVMSISASLVLMARIMFGASMKLAFAQRHPMSAGQLCTSHLSVMATGLYMGVCLM